MTLLLVWCALSCLSAYGFHRYKRWRHERDVQRIVREIESGTPDTPERIATIARADAIFAKHPIKTLVRQRNARTN